jgi:hypothetical protein
LVGIVALTVMGAVYLWLTALELSYLARGYTLQFDFGFGRPQTTHISFPPWRSVAALAGAGCIALAAILRIADKKGAVWVAWTALGGVAMTGCYDVYKYGTIGSPTSLKSLALLLGIALLVTYWRRFGFSRATPLAPPAL